MPESTSAIDQKADRWRAWQSTDGGGAKHLGGACVPIAKKRDRGPVGGERRSAPPSVRRDPRPAPDVRPAPEGSPAAPSAPSM